MANNKTIQPGSQIDQQAELTQSNYQKPEYIDQQQSFTSKLEQRQDVVGQSYRTIRDNPRTSAAIATGVAAAAAGAGFMFARRNRTPESVEQKVEQMNREGVSDAKS